MVVNRWARSISRSFMAKQGREGCGQEQDCLTHRFQLIISNSPGTGYLDELLENLRFSLQRSFNAASGGE